jgi:hypothetical protein
VSARPFGIIAPFLSRTSMIISVVCFWPLGGSLFFVSTVVKGSHCHFYCYRDSYACSCSTVSYCRYFTCHPRYCPLPCRSFRCLSGHLALSGRRLLWTTRSWSTVLSFLSYCAFLDCCCGFLSFLGASTNQGACLCFLVVPNNPCCCVFHRNVRSHLCGCCVHRC